MFFRILKKDLYRRKAMNGILLAFVFTAAIFLAASVTNFHRSNDALHRFAEMSGTPDYGELISIDQPEFEAWVRDNEHIVDYEAMHAIGPDRVTLEGGGLVNARTAPYLMPPVERFNRVFDKGGDVVSSVRPGEIAISINMAERDDLAVGDTLSITIGPMEETLTISHIIKDYLFGPETFIMNRAVVSQGDFDRFATVNGGHDFTLWNFRVSDMGAFLSDRNQQDFITGTDFQMDTIAYLYTLEQMSSVVMLIVSVALMAISVSMLGFTIRFTIEEDFREIGMMKAIGVRDSAVRRLYLVKYLVISVVGSALGGLLAMPLADLMIADLAKRIVLIDGNEIYLIRAACAACVVGLVMLFCWRTTGRIRKVTAIQAIREGATGERFRRKGILRLRGGRRWNVALFMACSDVLAGLRNYIIIFLALAVGLQMILLPLNILTTLTDGSFARYADISGGDLFVGPISTTIGRMDREFLSDPSFDELVERAERMERKYAENGVNVSVNRGVSFVAEVYASDPFDSRIMFAHTQTNGMAVEASYVAGMPPELPNEIAMTNVAMERLGVVLGSSVRMAFGEDDREYIITAAFESVNNMGESIILSPLIIPDMMFGVAVSAYQITFLSRESIPAQIREFKAVESEYEIFLPEEAVRETLGGIVEGLEQMIGAMALIALGIIALVTFLICNTLIARDKGAIALLKSIGFARRAIRTWLTSRIVIVTLAASAAGVGLSFALNPFVVRQTFGMMGAPSIPSVVDHASVFGAYPAMFLAVTMLVALLASHSANRVDMRNVGNLE